MLGNPKIGLSKKQFSPIQEEGKQNGKDSNCFVMVINGKENKPREDRLMPIWILVNNMPIASDALHQSDGTMFRRKAQKESAPDPAIMVNGIEKEYAARKATKMDSKGSEEDRIAPTGEGQQVEGKLLLNEGEMIWSPSKTFRTKKVANHEPYID
jgi:hypothetical protein